MMAMLLFVPLVLLALLFVFVAGLVNRRTRPFAIGLGVFLGLAVAFLAFFWARVAENDHSLAQFSQEQARRMAPQQQAKIVASAPSPPKPSVAEAKRPKMTMLAALRQAVVHAWSTRGSAPVAEAPEKPEVGGQRSAVRQPKEPDVPARPQPPAWVNAAPKMQDDRYVMSVWVGPFTTPLECERKLPDRLQEAVSEYAEISLDPEAAAVRLPDDALLHLVRERWTEVQPIEIGGDSQPMVSLHALVVFDADAQKKIKDEAQRLVITKRLQGAAVLFGGLLGLLALAWGGLRWATRRPEKT